MKKGSWTMRSNASPAVILQGPRSWPCRHSAIREAMKIRGEHSLYWPVRRLCQAIWKARAAILRGQCNRRMTPGHWPGATFIWAGFLIYRRSVSRLSRTIARHCRRETTLLIQRRRRRRDWRHRTNRDVEKQAFGYWLLALGKSKGKDGIGH